MRRALLAVLLAAACGSERTLFVPLPPSDSAKSIVAALKTDNALAVGAADLDEREGLARVKLPIEELGAGALYALLYDVPLRELGLSRGDVPAAAEGEEGFYLAAPGDIFRSKYLGGVVDPWDRSAELDPALAEFRVRGTAPPGRECARFEEIRISIPTKSHATYLFTASATVVVAGFEDGTAYELEVTGAKPIRTTTSAPHHSAHFVGPGEVWLAGEGGRVARASTLAELPPAPSGDRIDWLSGSGPNEPLELYALGEKGGLDRFENNVWTSLIAPGASDWRRDLTVIAPGEAIAVGVANGVVRVKKGVVEQERVEGGVSLMAAAFVPGLGALAGSIDGDVLQEKDGVWSVFGDSPLALPITQITAYGEGFVAAGGGGYFVQYHPAVGYCTEVQTGHPIIKHVTLLGDLVFLAGDRASGTTGDSFVSILVPAL